MASTPFQNLVISLSLDGSSLSSDAKKVGSAIAEIGPPAQASASSVAVVDRAAQNFLKTLSGMSDALRDEAAMLGMTTEQQLAYKAAKLGISEAAAPIIQQIGQEREALQALRDSTANASSAVNAFGETEAEASARIKEMVARSREAQSAVSATASATNEGAAAASAFGASSEQVRATITAQNAAMSSTSREMAEVAQALEALRAGAAQGATSFAALTEQENRLQLVMASGKLSMEEYDAMLAALWKDEDRLESQLNSLTARYDPLGAATRKLTSDEGLLKDAFDHGRISAEQYDKALAGIDSDHATIGLKELAQQEAQVERAFKSGAMSSAQYKAALADIAGSRAMLTAVADGANSGAKAMDSLGGHTKAARTEIVRLINDLANGNVGRFEQSAVVLAEQFDLLGALTSPLALGVAAVGVAVGAFAVAAYQGYEESDRLNKALASTGNYAGVTAGQVDAMAQRIGSSSGKVTDAQEALAGLVASGKVSGSALESVGAAAVAMSEATGESVDKVVAQFVAMSDDVAKGAAKMNEQYHFLTLAEYDEIKALEEHGDKAGAMKVAADALTTSLENQKVPLGTLPALWHAVGEAASSAWRQMMNLGKPDTPASHLEDLKKQLKEQEEILANGGSQTMNGQQVNLGTDVVKKAIADLKSEIADAQRDVDLHTDSAGIQGMLADQQAAGVAAAKHIDDMKKNLRTREQIRDDEIASARKYYAQARTAAQANPDQVDPANFSQQAENATVAAITAKYQSKATGSAGLVDKTRLEGDVQAVKDALAQELAGVSSAQKQLDAVYKSGGMSMDDYYQKSRDLIMEKATDEADAYNKEADILQKGLNNQKLSAAQRAQILKQVEDLHAKAAAAIEGAMLGVADSAATQDAELDKGAKAYIESLNKQADATEAEAQKVRDQADTYGLTKSALDQLLVSRAQSTLALDEEGLAMARNNNVAANVIANYERMVAADKKLLKSRQDLLSAQQGEDIAEQDKKRQDDIVKSWQQTIDGIGTDFHDGFLRMLTDGQGGWDSFTKSLKNTFETTVVNELYKEFAKPFIVSVIANIAGLTGGDSIRNQILQNNGMNGSVGGMGDLSSAFNSTASWFGLGGESSMVSGAASAISGGSIAGLGGVLNGSIGNGVASATAGVPEVAQLGSNAYGFVGTPGSGASLLGSAGSLLGAAGTGYGIGSVVGNLFGGGTAGTGSQVGGTVGGVAGSFLPFPGGSLVGSAIGSALGGLVGSLFGGGETRSGATYTSDGTTASKVGTGPSGGDPASEQVTSQINSTFQTIQSMASSLGGSITDLGTYHAGYEVSPKKGNSFVTAGFTTDPNEWDPGRVDLGGVKDSTTVLNDLSLQLQRSIITALEQSHLDAPYAKVLDGVDANNLSANDVTALINELNTLKSLFDSIKTMGSDFDNLKNASTDAQLAVVNLSGGVSQFATNAAYFEQHFVPAAEQTANQTKAVTDQLAALGESGISTNDQFRQVVQGIDLTTDAGQQLYAQMLALAPAFDQMTQAAAAAQQAAQEAADQQQSLWNNYYSAIYTSDQQAAVSQGQLQAQFAALGVTMPKTNAELSALIENMDTSTQPMKDLQNSLLALAPTFGQVSQAVQQMVQDAQAAVGQAQKAAISALSSSAQSLYTDRSNASSLLASINSTLTGSDADTSAQISALWSEMTGGGVSLTQQIDLATQLNDLITKRYQVEGQAVSGLTDQVKQIRDYVQSVKAGDLSTETPSEKLADAAQQYADTLAKAQGGDQDAIGNLTAAADNYLKLAQTYYASSDTYTQIFASVTSQLSAFGDALDSQSKSSDALSQQSLDQLKQLADIVSGQASSADSQYQGVMGQLAQQLSALDALEQAAGIQSAVPSILQGLPSEIAAQLASIIGNGAATGGDQITSLYQSVLGRTPTANEVSYWTDAFANGSKTLADWNYSADQELVNDAYQQILGRAADSGGLQFYTDKLYSGSESLDQIKSDLKGAKLTGAYATGGLAPAGLALVGENGPEIVDFKSPGRVYTNDELGSALRPIDFSKYGSGANAALVAEVRALRAELRQHKEETVQATKESATLVAARTAQGAKTVADSATKAADTQRRKANAIPAMG